MPLSDADKTAIREMIRDGISEVEKEGRWLRPGSLVGEKGGTETEYVPTLAKAKEIAENSAKEAIDAFKKDLPKWYQVNRRIDSASALVVVFVALAGAIYQVAYHQRGGVRNLVHWVAGTEAKVQTVLAVEKERWDADETFRTVTGRALDRWAKDQPVVENPIRSFVTRALEASPVLVFQGQQAFYTVDAINNDCLVLNTALAKAVGKFNPFEGTENVVAAESPEEVAQASFPDEYSGERNEGQRPIGLAQIINACRGFADLTPISDLDVPFFARVYETKEEGPPDRVFAILVVNRVPRQGIGSVSAKIGKNGGPAGLCVSYTTQNPSFRINGMRRETFELAGFMSESAPGSDFWEIDVSKAIIPHVGSKPNSPFVAQVLHSLNVRPIFSAEDLDNDDECQGVTPVDDQTISVRVLVFVNKGV
jgi:hypothetical protein